MGKSRQTGAQLDLLANIGIITFGSTGNFGSGNNPLGSAASVFFPKGCTKALIIGQVRLQSQVGTQADISAWIGKDGVATSVLRQSAIYTPGNGGTATFNSSTCPIISDVTGLTDDTTHTFQLYASTAQTANAGACTIFIIPLAG